MDSAAARRGVVRVCRRLDERGLIAGQDGNVSVRLGPDRILITPAGFSKADVTEEDLVTLGLDGARVEGRHEASTEVAMHLAVYRTRPDVGAVVHAHPPIATGFGVAGETLPAGVLPELAVLVGEVPLVPYGMPGTAALPAAMAPFLPNHDAFLLANHGVTTLGRTLEEAHQRMESVEHCAAILLTARHLGRVNALGAADLRQLLEARRRRGGGTADTRLGPSAGPIGGNTRSEA
ncbi:MAG: class II aldolase/adducin family protein [Gemmatimonadaceae bacterium]|nr:class II aldolase/adducin family protein [Gemmatimonadaceae bacterium]